MTYFELESARKKHEATAKMLRYCGYNAKCFRNAAEPQPYEIRIKGISDEEIKKVMDQVWRMNKSQTINIVHA